MLKLMLLFLIAFCGRASSAPFDEIDNNIPPPFSSQGCGYQYYSRNSQRTNLANYQADFGEFPWMVAIFNTFGANTFYDCGGSLIHPNVVLTSAHCVDREDLPRLKVRAGRWENPINDSSYESLSHQERAVINMTIHEKFDIVSLHNDFVLLVLSKPFVLAEHIETVCLPDPNEIFKESSCYSTGWGYENVDKLKRFELRVIERDVCENSVRRLSGRGEFFKLDKTFICAGAKLGENSCQGDAGSPLVCPSRKDQSRYILVGTAAGGYGCAFSGIKDVPDFYANVAGARLWIDQQMDAFGFDKSSYIHP